MISTTTVYVLIALYGVIVPVYYVIRRYFALMTAVRADEHSIQSLKREVKDSGCTDEAIEFWLMQDFQWRSVELNERHQRAAKFDVFFYMVCIMSAILTVIFMER